MSAGPTIVWFRRDLRLHDQAALQQAIATDGPVLPVYILDETAAPGGAARWWLHGSLAALHESLAARGSRLLLRRGRADVVLRQLAAETGARTVSVNRCYDPSLGSGDEMVRSALAEIGVELRWGTGELLLEPAAVRTQAGAPFQVFTPFWRRCRNLDWPNPLATALPARLRAPTRWPHSEALGDWGLRPTRGWAAEFPAWHAPGEAAARQRLATFIDAGLDGYDRDRDRPALAGTSRLSAALHFGELSPRQVVAAVADASREAGVMPRSRGAQVFLDELGWREFAHHLLWHFPSTPTQPLRPRYANFPWQRDAALLRAWRRGETGYPLVDAGMRELWRTGWMHNRVRMVVASFLVKQLLQPWTDGAAWFNDTLVDADQANNTLGWQWSAGCGADAAPYFRVFSPVLQGARFDPAGDYVRRWVPELACLPAKRIHCPWEMDAAELARAGVRLGHDYPRPLVDPKQGRERALRAFAEWRRACGEETRREKGAA